MGKICLYFAGATMTLFIGYAAVAAASSGESPWYLHVLLIAFILAGILCLATGIWFLVLEYGKLKIREKEATHQELINSFRSMFQGQGLTDEDIEKRAKIAAKGRDK